MNSGNRWRSVSLSCCQQFLCYFSLSLTRCPIVLFTTVLLFSCCHWRGVSVSRFQSFSSLIPSQSSPLLKTDNTNHLLSVKLQFRLQVPISCTTHWTFLYYLLYISVLLTVHFCTIHCTFLYYSLYILVLFTVHSCTISTSWTTYCTFLYYFSVLYYLLYIHILFQHGVLLTVHSCTVQRGVLLTIHICTISSC